MVHSIDAVLPNNHEGWWKEGPSSRNDTLLVADVGETVVGYLMGEFIANEYAVIMELTLLPRCRSRGIGTNLVHCFVNDALAPTCREVYVKPIVNNISRLTTYYERLGFSSAEQVEGFFQGDARRVVELTAAKE